MFQHLTVFIENKSASNETLNESDPPIILGSDGVDPDPSGLQPPGIATVLPGFQTIQNLHQLFSGFSFVMSIFRLLFLGLGLQ